MRETGAVLAVAECLCLTLSVVYIRDELNVLACIGLYLAR